MEIHIRKNRWPYWLLTMPIAHTADPERAESSRWPWGIDREDIAGDGPVRTVVVYRLRLVGVLHRLFGLVVWVR